MNKKVHFFIISMAFSTFLFSQTPIFINEIHYDNTGADAGEGVEIAGPAGTDLTGWTIRGYTGSTGATYGTITHLSGSLQNNATGELYGFQLADYKTEHRMALL